MEPYNDLGFVLINDNARLAAELSAYKCLLERKNKALRDAKIALVSALEAAHNSEV